MARAVGTLEPAGEPVFADPFLALVAVLVVAGLALSVWLLVRNLRILRRIGLDPVASAASRAAVGHRPGVPLGQRLQELDELHRRGVISDAEHSLARHKVLTGG